MLIRLSFLRRRDIMVKTFKARSVLLRRFKRYTYYKKKKNAAVVFGFGLVYGLRLKQGNNRRYIKKG